MIFFLFFSFRKLTFSSYVLRERISVKLAQIIAATCTNVCCEYQMPESIQQVCCALHMPWQNHSWATSARHKDWWCQLKLRSCRTFQCGQSRVRSFKIDWRNSALNRLKNGFSKLLTFFFFRKLWSFPTLVLRWRISIKLSQIIARTYTNAC